MKYGVDMMAHGGRKAGSCLAQAGKLVFAGLSVSMLFLLPPSIAVHAQQNPVLDPVLKSNKASPMLLQADELVYDNRHNKVVAKGNVEIFYNKYTLLADSVVYDRNQNILMAEGNVRIKEPNGAVVTADRIKLTDDFREGFINSLKIKTGDDATITAEKATRTGGNVTVFKNGSFTPCKLCREHPEKPPTWRVKATRVIHDKNAHTIEYENATFELLGVPIAWVPYFKHPDPTVKRQSGFLIPNAYYSDKLGYVSETPYYFALARNYDLTVTPVVTTKAGYMLKGKWRHRLANGSYSVDFDGAYDDSPAADTPNNNRFRGSVSSQGNFELGSYWNFGWDATIESDKEYRRFYKLDDISVTDRVSQVYLVGQSERNYLAVRGYHFGGLVINDDSSAKSWVRPIIDYDYILNNPVLGGELSFNANAVSMNRDNASWAKGWQSTSSQTSRASAELKWRNELIDPIGEVFTPFARARGDVLQYTDQNNKDQSKTRGNLTAGLEYRYPFLANIGSSSHIIEPIGQIIYRKSSGTKFQDRLPNEDAQSLVYDDTLLFDVNKFSGYDMMETGTRANVGIRYTASFAGGGNIRAVFGQSYHISGDNAYGKIKDSGGKIVNSGLETGRSDYVAGVYFEPSSYFGLIAQGRFDQDNFELRRTDVHSWFNYGPFNGSVNYVKQRPKLTADNPKLTGEEIYGNLGIQLSEHWSLTGNIRYDLNDSRVERHGGGLTYADECFLFGISYDHTTADDTRQIDGDTTIGFRLSLKHLGGFQTSTDINKFVSSK